MLRRQTAPNIVPPPAFLQNGMVSAARKQSAPSSSIAEESVCPGHAASGRSRCAAVALCGLSVTAAAAVTSRLRIGSGVCLVIEHDPIITAKQVASVDHISGGRFEFGVGAGWNREEMQNHGTDPRTRMRLLKERVEAMKAIWTEDEASFHGEFVNFDRIWSWPKPVQRPHPPILVGGAGPTVLERVLAYGDAWFPNYAGADTLARAAELRARAERPIELQVISVPAEPKDLEALEQAGCTRACHWLPSGNRSVVETALAEWESAIGQFTGEA